MAASRIASYESQLGDWAKNRPSDASELRRGKANRLIELLRLVQFGSL